MLATHGHLSKVANGEDFFPRFHLQDPVLTADANNAISTATGLPPLPKVEGTMFSSGATFFNYAPCVLSESYTGANAALTGLNIAPTLLQVEIFVFFAFFSLLEEEEEQENLTPL